MPTPKLLSIQVGLPTTIGDPDEPTARFWTTGFFKSPVTTPVRLNRTNLAGDGQADLRNHGGPDKAVNVYPSEHYSWWEAELASELDKEPLPPAAFGENFTTAGLLEGDVCIGDVFEVGEARVQVSQPRQPCWKLARCREIRGLALRVQQTGRTGWYFRVLQEGEVEAGCPLILVDRPHGEWTVAAANAVMHERLTDFEAARALAACPALSTSWRENLARRASTGAVKSTSARLDDPG